MSQSIYTRLEWLAQQPTDTKAIDIKMALDELQRLRDYGIQQRCRANEAEAKVSEFETAGLDGFR